MNKMMREIELERRFFPNDFKRKQEQLLQNDLQKLAERIVDEAMKPLEISLRKIVSQIYINVSLK